MRLNQSRLNCDICKPTNKHQIQNNKYDTNTNNVIGVVLYAIKRVCKSFIYEGLQAIKQLIINLQMMSHNKFPLLFLLGVSITANAANIYFTGSDREIIEIKPEKNTGLDNLFVIYDTSGVDATYTTNSSSITWMRYSNLGGGFAETISNIEKTPDGFKLPNVQGDMGYIIEDGDRRTYFWVVNYLPHKLTLNDIIVSEESDCDRTILNVTGNGDPIHYFSINGQQLTLDRQINVAYEQESWDEDTYAFVKSDTNSSFRDLSHSLSIMPPVYCSTYFNITGDRFLQQWGMEVSAESQLFHPTAINVKTSVEQQTEENDDESVGSNQISANITGLGGSAPADIKFRSYTTEGVIHNEWQMASDPDFENITYRFTEQDLDYTFTEQGTTYIRYVGSNSNGSCEAYSDVYEVQISDSELKCPNAFSPGASEGVNDEWKVSYRSLTEFECWIFDRYGNQIFHFTDPSKGWDGKHNGKLVKSGVYYYVIQAKGSDGKNYKKSGDINIINYKSYGNQNGTPVE